MSGWLLAAPAAAADDKYVWGAIGAVAGAFAGVATAWIKGRADVDKVEAENQKRIDELQKEYETRIGEMQARWKHEGEETDRVSTQEEEAAKREQLEKLREAASLLADALKDKHATGYRADLRDAQGAIASATRDIRIDDQQLTGLIERLVKTSDSEDKAEADDVSAALRAYKPRESA